jgi:hypothetical protein
LHNTVVVTIVNDDTINHIITLWRHIIYLIFTTGHGQHCSHRHHHPQGKIPAMVFPFHKLLVSRYQLPLLLGSGYEKFLAKISIFFHSATNIETLFN